MPDSDPLSLLPARGPPSCAGPTRSDQIRLYRQSTETRPRMTETRTSHPSFFVQAHRPVVMPVTTRRYLGPLRHSVLQGKQGGRSEDEEAQRNVGHLGGCGHDQGGRSE